MIRSRQELEDREDAWLAPYAQRSRDSRGRQHPEPEHAYRPVYQRDRDRVVHSTAFRRLEYKTQVFLNHEGDHYRTRLTHTLEVSQIARTIARALALNEDLVEVVALAHDLGHTPFGHTGEEALRELMKDHGGFEHNVHGLRVVDVLERRYAEFPGLNLAWETRECIAKHSSRYDHPSLSAFDAAEKPLLEGQVVDAADSIAYSCHDLDDGLASGLLDERGLASVELFRRAREEADRRAPAAGERQRRAGIVRALINTLVTDFLQATQENLERFGVKSVADVRRAPAPLAGFSERMKPLKKEFEDFLFRALYRHYRVCRMANKARHFLERLFEAYISDSRTLPDDYQERARRGSLHQVVCDYIAGMTDRYAQDEYLKLFMPYEHV
ncbi:MAG TPA: deoxyguanosinetriphosphate triphosphohydrolase [Candidatus Brocadiia bacterium]|nr:deoxyguanosinetriphosphate triphosphohydrolase [Candidatus Brocadiia bacterium]